MVNAPKKNRSPLLAGKYCKSTKNPHDNVIKQIQAGGLGRRNCPSVRSIAQLTIYKEAFGGEKTGNALVKQSRKSEMDPGLCG